MLLDDTVKRVVVLSSCAKIVVTGSKDRVFSSFIRVKNSSLGKDLIKRSFGAIIVDALSGVSRENAGKIEVACDINVPENIDVFVKGEKLNVCLFGMKKNLRVKSSELFLRSSKSSLESASINSCKTDVSIDSIKKDLSITSRSAVAKIQYSEHSITERKKVNGLTLEKKPSIKINISSGEVGLFMPSSARVMIKKSSNRSRSHNCSRTELKSGRFGRIESEFENSKDYDFSISFNGSPSAIVRVKKAK
ncbi:hypothetical protein HYD_5410 [Candidatus Hydrogenosomobacter endosymbioticus]|uniref:Adhesin domain-containing protein n=2 Tax=Candidatus Hydrogenosomobacter endosymbioticus TaxID=2558174 RepID=A0ABN6L3E1_9PROT|nr:hypothetical protein HYD_5410 [Candidatus Hydrogenosomobacter endosymbioticus]